MSSTKKTIRNSSLMVSSFNLWIISGLICSLLSCQSAVGDGTPSEAVIDKRAFLEYVALHGKKISATDSILVIPGVGCGGCISYAQMYFEQHAENTHIFYIFTGIDDLKIFRQEIPKEYWTQKNVFVDSLNYMMKHGFDSNYPSWLIELGEGYGLKTFE